MHQLPRDVKCFVCLASTTSLLPRLFRLVGLIALSYVLRFFSNTTPLLPRLFRLVTLRDVFRRERIVGCIALACFIVFFCPRFRIVDFCSVIQCERLFYKLRGIIGLCEFRRIVECLALFGVRRFLRFASLFRRLVECIALACLIGFFGPRFRIVDIFRSLSGVFRFLRRWLPLLPHFFRFIGIFRVLRHKCVLRQFPCIVGLLGLHGFIRSPNIFRILRFDGESDPLLLHGSRFF